MEKKSEIYYLDGRPVTLQYRPQAKRYTIRIHAQLRQIIVTIPKRGSVQQARRFAEDNKAWINTKWNKLCRDVIPFNNDQTIPLRGIDVHIRHDATRFGVAQNDRQLIVGGNPEHLTRRIRDFLKSEARKDIVPLCTQKAASIGLPTKPIRIKNMHTRWGSCGACLNFNWRLIMAPAFVLDYVVAHEVAHLRHPDHQDDFWALCKTLSPHVSAARNWLPKLGTQLFRYG